MLRRKTIDNSRIRQPLMEEVALTESSTSPKNTNAVGVDRPLASATSSIKNGVTVTTTTTSNDFESNLVADEAL